jgi:hypothetical protein
MPGETLSGWPDPGGVAFAKLIEVAATGDLSNEYFKRRGKLTRAARNGARTCGSFQNDSGHRPQL